MGSVLRPLGLGAATALMRPAISRPGGPGSRRNARSLAPLTKSRHLGRSMLRVARGLTRGLVGARTVAARPRRPHRSSPLWGRSILSRTRFHRAGWLRGRCVAAFIESAPAVVAPAPLWRLFHFGRGAWFRAPCAFTYLGIAAAPPSRGDSLPRSRRGTLSRSDSMPRFSGHGTLFAAGLGGVVRRELG